MTDLKNKVALITGSARGLGRAIAERYASLGADIVINYSKDRTSANEAVKNIRELGVRVIAIRADISKVSEVEKLFAETIKAFGKINIVVANAGVELADVPVTEFTEEQFDRLFAINTKGTYFTLQYAARHIEDNGRIINISSSSAAFPFRGFSIYGGSKTAPNYMIRVLAQEIGHRGVTVNSVVPYAVANAGIFTNININDPSLKWLLDMNPMKRMAAVEDVANAAEFFASDLSSFISGQQLLVNGGGSQ